MARGISKRALATLVHSATGTAYTVKTIAGFYV